MLPHTVGCMYFIINKQRYLFVERALLERFSLFGLAAFQEAEPLQQQKES